MHRLLSVALTLMARTITLRKLRRSSAATLSHVQAGETLIVTRDGVPVAELRALGQRRFAPRKAFAEASARAPHIDAARFWRDLDQIVSPSADG
jgi:antitoxin (DNA-binding transcriptional repressor) of toxin-antitoxin stability system